jgi:methyl halide transferase
MDLSPHFWTNRYKENTATWDAGGITQPLKEYIDQLENKELKILIPGAGNAHEAEYLFRQGFKNVFVLDFSEEPLQNLRKRLPDLPENNFLFEDFFTHQGTYDLILEQTFFCAIDPKLRSAYALKVHELLKPGGKLVGVLFAGVFEKEGPPYGGQKEEYIGYFEPMFRMDVIGECYNSIKPRAGRELFINLLKHPKNSQDF